MSFSQVYEAILSNERYAEVAAFRTSSESADGTPLTVRFVREDPGAMGVSGSEAMEYGRGVVKCLALVHETLGGIVAPKAGDEFKLAKTKGGEAVWGWRVESVRGSGAGWDLTVMLRERREAGGKRMERGQ